eukprot:90283_1
MTDEFIDFTRIQDAKIKQIDNALAQYCTRLGVTNYRDENGIGFFFNVFKGEKLYEHHLNDDADPNYCAHAVFHWQLPIPAHIQIPDTQTELFTFYIFQYCYKRNKPPSDNYIQHILIPQCNGTFTLTSSMDDLLGSYFKSCGRNDYYDENNKGKLMIFLNDNGMDTDAMIEELENQTEPKQQKLMTFCLDNDYRYYPNKMYEVMKFYHKYEQLPIPITINNLLSNASTDECMLKWQHIGNVIQHEMYPQIAYTFTQITKQ